MRLTIVAFALGAVMTAAVALAPDPSGVGGDNEYCPDGTEGGDILVARLGSIFVWGTVGEVTGYSISATSCNVGDKPTRWVADRAAHPLIAQHLFRLRDGRFEQVGLSWVKHGFTTELGEYCCDDCVFPGTFDLLGVGCSDTYTTGMNGSQAGFIGKGGLGPRSDVDAARGRYRFPYPYQGKTGDAIYKRLQVRLGDLDPDLNEGALYFGEVQYVSPDEDTESGRAHNSVAYRRVLVGPNQGSGFNLTFTDDTAVGVPAVQAWAAQDPGVGLTAVDIPGDGRVNVAWRVTDEGDGTFRYEYLIHNQNSHRSVSGLRIPFGEAAPPTELDFHAPVHHSGEPYGRASWSATALLGRLRWHCAPFDDDENANAIRWGTAHSFGFRAAAPPESGWIDLELFRPGGPQQVSVNVLVPTGRADCTADFDHDAVVGFGDLVALLSAWGPCGGCAADMNYDGTVGFADLVTLLSAWGACD